ncbi:MAG: type I restriction endonuclease [Ignavibacteriales bacterium]|nr:type I restriction endonuclease [Ignavibacteriales bacterium]
MTTPKEIVKLVERFDHNRDQYLSGKYNEAQLRQEFVNPFFAALGWDIENRLGYAEPYKEVIHEDAIKIGSATKAPDYAFRIGGTRKFFVEAKNPSVNLKEDATPAFQLRRYAWSAKLPLSILTDFEEFVIYDCRTKPLSSDKASTARVQYLTYKEYIPKWETIASVFSKESVLKGSFDKYADSARGKKGTAEVDDAFLKEIESWRELLAKNIALRNPKLSQPELNFAVQRTIDRIIFLRICEDRGIEPYGRLQSLVNGEHIYRRLYEQFYRADEKYNSGLFHFEAEKGRPELLDELTPHLHIDDKPLKEILANLYYPDSPYEFSVLPADILGQVYEQFLGKVIRLTAGHQAKVEEKPEVKKAGGVYYTPTYIVDYIVKNTVGRLLDPEPPLLVGEGEVGKRKAAKPITGVGKLIEPEPSPPSQGGDKEAVSSKQLAKPLTPKEASKLRILDPACGSGSFLIGAYQYLLNWHRDWYEKDGAEKHATGKTAEIFRGPGGEWRLTTAERKRILLNNIYGVDIDSQAVEVTKLSLLLKVLEGENEQTISQQLKMFHERALPDLGSNIKCGNSLIGPDFYEGKQLSLLDDEEKNRINVFDWKSEFKEIMDAGGFDAVIGNPPYGVPFSPQELGYLSVKYKKAAKFPDSYCYFIIKSVDILRLKGAVSMIVPNTFCDLENCDDFRKWLLTECMLGEIWQTGWAFKSAIVDTLVFRITRQTARGALEVTIKIGNRSYKRLLQEFTENDLAKIDYRNTPDNQIILRKVTKDSIQCGSLCTIKAGVKMYEKGKGIPPQSDKTLQERPYSKKGKQPKGWKPLYRGEHVSRYALSTTDEFVEYGPWLAAPRSVELFAGQKILMRRTDDKLRACLESDSAICVNSCHVIRLKEGSPGSYSPHYLLGIFNCRLLQRIFELQNPQMVQKVFAEIKVIYVERLPIRAIDFSNPSDKSRHDKMVQLVEQMLSLHKQLPAAKTEQEKTVIQRQIEATDKQIDALVYELHDLTKEEIAIVEG